MATRKTVAVPKYDLLFLREIGGFVCAKPAGSPWSAAESDPAGAFDLRRDVPLTDVELATLYPLPEPEDAPPMLEE